jgi:hypothetical protein
MLLLTFFVSYIKRNPPPTRSLFSERSFGLILSLNFLPTVANIDIKKLICKHDYGIDSSYAQDYCNYYIKIRDEVDNEGRSHSSFDNKQSVMS